MLSDDSLPGQAGVCNTQLSSQNFLQPSLDYLTFSFTQPDLRAFYKTLRALALFVHPKPVDNWLKVRKSRNVSKQIPHYRRYMQNYRIKCANHRSFLSNCIELEFNKPFMVSDGRYLKNRLATLLPLSGGCDIDAETGVISATLRLSGNFFDALSLSKQVELVFLVASFPDVRVSRMDVALDDFSKKLIPYDLMAKACQDTQFSGFRKWQQILNPVRKDGNREGTLYLGSRTSKNFSRCYWKDDRLRLEREIKGNEAHENFLLLVEMCKNSTKEISNYLARTAIGGIDFVERVTLDTGLREKNLVRCKRFSWWQDFVSLIGDGLRLKVGYPLRTADRAFNWLDRQVVGVMCAIMLGMGEEKFYNWFGDKLKQRAKNLSVYHEQLAEQVKHIIPYRMCA